MSLNDVQSDKGQSLRAMLPLFGLLLLVCALVAGGFVFFFDKKTAPAQPPVNAAHGQMPQEGKHAADMGQLDKMVDRLAQKLAENPNNPDGWAMLARSQATLGRYPDALASFAKAMELAPNDAGLLIDYADVWAVSQSGKLAGQPLNLLQRALKIDPDNLKGLALAGTEAFQRADYVQALKLWRKAESLAPADSELLPSIRGGIADAESRSGKKSEKVAAKVAAAADGISGVVTLAPELKSRVSSEDYLFIYAKSAQGGKMPLAVIRQKVGPFPFAFNLNDQQAMMPQAALSSEKEVVVTVRISKSGDSRPQSGDLQAASGVISNRTQNLKLHIDRIVP